MKRLRAIGSAIEALLIGLLIGIPTILRLIDILR